MSLHASFPLPCNGESRVWGGRKPGTETGHFFISKLKQASKLLGFLFVCLFNNNYHHVLFHLSMLLWIKILIEDFDREHLQTPLVFFREELFRENHFLHAFCQIFGSTHSISPSIVLVFKKNVPELYTTVAINGVQAPAEPFLCH